MSDDAVDSLSFGDALFLHLERKGVPLHMASLCVFEGKLTFATLLAQVQSKLPGIPRYLQRVVSAPMEVGLPIWEYATDFDIHNHVRELTLKYGTENELRSVASTILGKNLDRRNPLWDFTLISGLKGNRTALLARVHHCLADGVSGIELLKQVLDQAPTPPRTRRARLHIPMPSPCDPASALADHFVRTWFSNVERVLKVQSEALGFVQRLTAAAGQDTAGFNGSGQTAKDAGQREPTEVNGLLTELASPAQRLPFNVVCRGPQKFAWTEVSLADVKAIKTQHGTTVNDVVLALISSVVRDYILHRGCAVHHRELRVVVPVSVRTHSESQKLGNRITFVPISIPLNISSPARLLEVIHGRTSKIKSAHVAELIAFAGTVLGLIPSPLQALVAPLASQLPLSLCNLICTNVPGPAAPLYLAEHKMIAFYPYVPIGGEMGMNCAALTYDGTMFIGFTGDVNAVPELDVLPRLLQRSFGKLRRTLETATKGKLSTKAQKDSIVGVPKKPSEGDKQLEEPTLSFAAGA